MIPTNLLSFAAGVVRLRGQSLLMTGWIATGLSGPPQATGALLPRTESPDVTGAWTLCASVAFVPARKGAPPYTLSGWVTTMANVCTEVVFQANGTGYAGLTGGKKYAFTWQRHAGTLTVTYPEPAAATATRLGRGEYGVTFGVRPADGDTPAFTKLVLSTKREKLFLLGPKRTN